MSGNILNFKEKVLDIDLLCGAITAEGSVARDCKIRAMTGDLRKKLAQTEYRKDGLKLVRAVFEHCILEIAGKEYKTGSDYNQMLVADSDYFLMKIRQLSMGDSITLEMHCPNELCDKGSYFADLFLSDIKTFTLDDTKCVIEDIEGKLTRTISTSSDNFDIKFRLPTCLDQSTVAKLAKSNPIASQYALYARILISVNGTDITNDNAAQFLKELGTTGADKLDELRDLLLEDMPGVESIHHSECPSCGYVQQMEVCGGDFLFTRSKKRTKNMSKIG